jgi:hypothetical protein
MGYKICFPGFAPGVALWHGCEGDGKDSTFQDLLDQIVRHADDPCTAIAKPGQACPAERPPSCKKYPGTKPKNCGCSQSKSVPLDFTKASLPINDLGGFGPTPGPGGPASFQGMRFVKVGKYGTPPTKDFDIEVEAQTEYKLKDEHKSKRNGFYRKSEEFGYEFGRITMSYNQQTTFRFTLKQTDNDQPIEVKELSFTVFDLDGKDEVYQYLMASDFSGYVVEDDTRLVLSQEDGKVKFAGQIRPEDGEGRVPDPSAVDDLSKEQRNVAVMLIYKNVSTFDLTFGVWPPKTEPEDPKKIRDFLFAGMSSLGDQCEP